MDAQENLERLLAENLKRALADKAPVVYAKGHADARWRMRSGCYGATRKSKAARLRWWLEQPGFKAVLLPSFSTQAECDEAWKQEGGA